MSALLINGVPVECINSAAVTYHVPATLIISVIKAENGRIGQANVNRNGTLDYGPMQINSIWLANVARYGYTAWMLQYDPCANVEVGTWILSQQIANNAALWRADNGQTMWQGVGDYHSHQPTENAIYRYRVAHIYRWLMQQLDNRAVR
ncbi:MAG: lytic transglycosylase domain-containing protein [Gammaproteobacteria bacterium]